MVSGYLLSRSRRCQVSTDPVDVERLELEANRLRLQLLAGIAGNPALSDTWHALADAEEKVMQARRDARERGE